MRGSDADQRSVRINDQRRLYTKPGFCLKLSALAALRFRNMCLLLAFLGQLGAQEGAEVITAADENGVCRFLAFVFLFG